MLELLQMQPVNGSDISFGIFEIATIVGWAISVCGLYFTLKYAIKETVTSLKTLAKENKEKFDTLEKEHDSDVVNLKEKILDAVTKKNAMRAELSNEIEKSGALTHKRIDAVRDDLKEYKKQSDSEFKALNSTLSEMKGMLTQILNK